MPTSITASAMTWQPRPAPSVGGVLVDEPATPTLGPWFAIGTGVNFKVAVCSYYRPPTAITRVPPVVSVDLSTDEGETFTTTQLPPGTVRDDRTLWSDPEVSPWWPPLGEDIDRTWYTFPCELGPGDGTHARLRVGGNVALACNIRPVVAFYENAP